MNISRRDSSYHRMEKESKALQVIRPFYCRLALILCQQARELLYDYESSGYASQICSFISTLCKMNNCQQCWDESTLCSRVSVICTESGKLKEARELCEKARRLCPKSFTVNAS